MKPSARSGRQPIVFVDTSFLYASADPADDCHVRAIEDARRAAEAGARPVATWEVVVETLTLCVYRGRPHALTRFVDGHLPAIEIITFPQHLRPEALAYFRSANRMRRLSMTDALSRVAILRLLGNCPTLAYDRDFQRMGLRAF